MPNQTESVIALLQGRVSVRDVARAHGVTESEVESWRALFVDGLAQPRRSAPRRGAWVAATAALLVTVGVASRTAWAGNCASTLPAPLVTLCADEPALATEVNGNFRQLVTWLEAKVGSVASNAITAGTINAGAISTTGAVTVGTTLGTNGNLTVGGNLTVRGSALGGYQAQSVNTDYVAATDGFAVVALVGDANGARCYAHGLVDGTLRVRESLHLYTTSDVYVNDASFTFPVRRGSTWRVNLTNTSATCTANVAWVALHP